MERADVLIVGGGPAGATCARRLVAAGRDVLLVDARAFPRPKPCAGWITPEAVARLPFPLDEYAASHTLQPLTGFRVGRIGGRAVDVDYDRPVSYGIRREEFDAELLRRSGARTITGERIVAIEHEAGVWRLNGRLTAPVLVGAGGHGCPVARHLAGPPNMEALVVTSEAEYPLEGDALAACRVEPTRPELYFSPDLRGYGWCFRKGRYLNVGLGRRDAKRLPHHLDVFLRFLVAQRRVLAPPHARWRGHAYLVREGRTRRVVGDGVLLAGDAAGLAFPASGEGILPALVSGDLAAETILAAGDDCREDRLAVYARSLEAALGPVAAARHLPAPIAALGSVFLLASRRFVEHVVLDRWFLHRASTSLSAPART